MNIVTNGTRVHYEVSGKAGAPVVMLSHSLGSSMVMWQPQMEVLEAHFRVLRYDVRGHGDTEAPESPYALDQLGEDAVSLMDGLGIDRVHLVGLSMGGMIGQGLALNHSSRLRSLALCDTAAVLPQDARPIWQERIQRAREKGMTSLVDDTIARWFTQPFLAKSPPAVERIRTEFLATPVVGYVACSQAIMGLNYLGRLSGIKLPTLIVVGADDPGTPVSASEAIHRMISQSQLVIIPAAAHLSNVEQPDAFNKALMDFLLAQP